MKLPPYFHFPSSHDSMKHAVREMTLITLVHSIA